LDPDRSLAELMRKAQEGDGRAYNDLLVEVAARVRAFARKELDGSDGVEDVAQETLLAVHRHRHTWDPARAFLPWMYAIARHRLLDFVAQRRRRERHDLATQTGDGEAPSAAAIVERAIPAFDLRQALARLSARQREIIQMLKLEELSVAEISARTGLSRSSIKVTAHRGYKVLRKLIAEEGQ
jgi:RNA polymerase sigma-70 factor (ECF subfamily)